MGREEYLYMKRKKKKKIRVDGSEEKICGNLPE